MHILIKKGKKNLDLIPKSGSFSSSLVGLIAVLIILTTLNEGLPKLKLPAARAQNEVQIQWDSEISDFSQIKPRFVEANPDSPQNPPDQVDQFSFRNQQAAQNNLKKKTTSEKIPEVHHSAQSRKIVQSSAKIIKESQLISAKGKVNIRKEKTLAPSLPAALKSRNQKDYKDGVKITNDEFQFKENRNALIVSSTNDRNEIENSRKTDSQKLQRKRPKLSPQLIRGPLMKSTTSAPRLGKIAIECRLHPYGAYIQEMLKSIEEQWNQLVTGSNQYIQHDRLPGKITLRFKLQASGQILNLTRIDTEGYSLAAELCRQAIASRVPFGKWTSKMISDFGQSDEITLSFQYL